MGRFVTALSSAIKMLFCKEDLVCYFSLYQDIFFRMVLFIYSQSSYFVPSDENGFKLNLRATPVLPEYLLGVIDAIFPASKVISTIKMRNVLMLICQNTLTWLT